MTRHAPARLVAAALVCGAVFFVAARARAALGPRYGGELTVGVADLAMPGEPGVPRGFGARLVAGLVHETLVGIDPVGIVSPRLAEGWTTAAGGREWTLALRPGMRFQDGAGLGSADVARSLRRFLLSSSIAAARFAEGIEGGAAFRARTTEELPGLTTPDAAHVVVRGAAASGALLAALASPAAAITSPSGAGCGPFVPTLALPGRRVVLTAFPGHVRGRPYLDGVQVVALTDSGTVVPGGPPGPLDLAPGRGGPTAIGATLLLVLDPARPPLDGGATRAAAAAAIDRADLVRNLLPGADPAPSLIVPALLAPLGRARPEAHATVSGSLLLAVAKDVPPLVSQRVVAHLTDVGLRVDVTPTAPGAVLATRSSARLLLWTPEVAEPGLALEEIAAVGPPVEPAREALAAAAREDDADARRRLLYRAEADLRAAGALVPLASIPVSLAAGRPGIHGATVDLRGRLVLEDAWVEP
jgi:ABC-type transport system substrate-binding protein